MEGLWTPRGPGSALQALACMGVSLAAGWIAGFYGRSRWYILLAPVTFWVVLEVVRAGAQGPSVDAVRFTTFGMLALVTGRLPYAVLTLLPMAVGAAFGAGAARRRAGVRAARLPRYAGRAVTVLSAVVVAGVAVVVALPGRTAPVAGGGGVAELAGVSVNGHRFGVMIRGADAAAPVLLYVPGPPGGSEIGAMRRHLAGLEQRFVVATWDRRGGGKSFAAFEPTATLTTEDEVRSTVAMAEYLRERFRRDRVYLAAHSGGSMVGVLAVQRRPELFAAYIGIGQAVAPPAADAAQYQDTLAWARATGKAELARRLVELGPPPYGDGYSYEPMLTSEPKVYAYDHGPNSEGAGGFAESLGVPEYSLLDQAHVIGGLVDAYDLLYPRMQGIDLRRQVNRLDVPVYFAVGAHEVPVRVRLLSEWSDLLQAPHKETVTFATSGHRPQFEQPAEFVRFAERVLAETS
ncbi:alpha/beta fold hydrolase [Sphaerisporangium rubeum]|uniref:Pimeloyl-ACP methyl ester carboxylesterase n=1 Tax=Sphaerisporangium rubeum TaxID=321317 RepID=A0A7X0M590_9ACTN|nr:pimeloyl-ACP methyl ester carboxylesterase [Sphaerisporangium rubeum]